MKKKIAVLLIFALLLGTLCGCEKPDISWFTDLFQTQSQLEEGKSASAEPEAEPEKTDIVTEVASEIESFGLAYQPDYGMHPYNCLSLNNRIIFSFIYEPLFVVTTEFHPVPVLADGFDVSDDGQETVIYLKEGVTFHDGSPLTAKDAVYSIENAKGTAYYGSRFSAVTELTVVDDFTFTIRTYNAYESVPTLLDIPIIKEGTYDDPSPLGTGPYYVDGTERLVRYQDWWQDRPPLEDYPEIALTQATTTADIRDNFEYENVNLVVTDPNSSAYAGFHNDYELWNQTTTVMQYVGYNIGTKVFSNYGLRGAITYAIDRESIVSELMGGFAKPAVLPCSPDADLYDTRLADSFSYSIANYHMQLDSASVEDLGADGVLDLYVPSLGYSVPVSGTMIVCSSSFQRVQAATKIVDALNELGFDLELKSMEYNEYKKALLENNFDLYYGEVRLSSNFDLSPFFSYYGSTNYGNLSDSTMLNLSNLALANSGNSYNLYKRLCERGYITPVLFKSYAVYTTRGAVSNPTRYIDWFLPDMG